MYERTILTTTLAFLSACLGTDTGNPVVDSRVSECKSDRESSGASIQALTLPSASTTYEGFECLRWERDADHIRFDAYNINGGCHVTWRGGAEQNSSGELAFVLSNPSCAVAACGSCLYDATFDLDTQKTPLDDSADVKLIQANCPGERVTIGSWQLQAGEAASGIACKYAKGLDWHAGRLNTCGTRHAPCRGKGLCGAGSTAGTTPNPCDDGLECTPVSEYESMCLERCTSNEDCTLQDILECRDGVCQLK